MLLSTVPLSMRQPMELGNGVFTPSAEDNSVYTHWIAVSLFVFAVCPVVVYPLPPCIMGDSNCCCGPHASHGFDSTSFAFLNDNGIGTSSSRAGDSCYNLWSKMNQSTIVQAVSLVCLHIHSVIPCFVHRENWTLYRSPPKVSCCDVNGARYAAEYTRLPVVQI